MILALLLSCAFFVVLSDTAIAETSGDLDYRLIKANTEVEITGYHGAGGNVVIPGTIDGKAVTSIGDSAFYQCSSMTSVSLPNSITIIGWSAFYDCSQLTSVSIPSSVSFIGDSAFSDCSSLASVSFPNGLKSIGSNAFQSCLSLGSVTIPSSVLSIGQLAFSNCESLTTIFVDPGNPNYASSNGVLYDKNMSVLMQCPGGKTGTVTVPEGVIDIWNQAFDVCTSLHAIEVDPYNQDYASIGGVLYDKYTTHLIRCPGGKAGAFQLPEGVSSIGINAFSHCHSLTSIIMSEGVTSIGIAAFFDCPSLVSVTIPGSMTKVPMWAFYGCTGLTSVTMPSNITSIDSEAFSGCTALTEMRFEGNAPSCASGWIDGHHPDLIIHFWLGSSGFTTPVWNGVATIGLAPPSAPSAPTNINVDVVSDHVILTWTAPGGPVSGYLIFRGPDPGNLTSIGNSSTTSYLDTTMSFAHIHHYMVRAINPEGQSDDSATVMVYVPMPIVQVGGRVVDQEGNGLAKVTVALDNATDVLTDSGGYFIIMTTWGEHTLTINGTNIETRTVTTNVSGSFHDVGNIAMTGTDDGPTNDPFGYLMIATGLVVVAGLLVIALFVNIKRKGKG
jgi:hypothetical protein